MVVTSAGNFGSNPVTGEIGYAGLASPGNARSALTVGAVKTFDTVSRVDDELGPYSSRGPTWYDGSMKPDVVAPGHALVAISDPSTTLYRNAALRASVAPYLKLSGTSMTAAVATGVAALVLQANRLDLGSPALTPNTVKALLQYTSIPVADDGVGTALEQDAGSINAAGATSLAYAIDPAALSGQPLIEHAFTPYNEYAGTTHAWAQNIVWGDNIVSGDTILWNRPACALNVVWGDRMMGGDNIVWGDVASIGVAR